MNLAEISAPVRPPTTPPAKWTQEKKLAFRNMGPAALCIVATDGPVSVTTYDAGGNVKARFGHNRGCWPMRLACTGSWEDRISEGYDKNPFVETGVAIRIWAPSTRSRDRLIMPVTDLIAARADEAMGATLVNGFVDLGPDLQLDILEMELFALAERHGVPTWDDAGLSAYLDEQLQAAEKLVV